VAAEDAVDLHAKAGLQFHNVCLQLPDPVFEYGRVPAGFEFVVGLETVDLPALLLDDFSHLFAVKLREVLVKTSFSLLLQLVH
jgi:hypothetical protein